MAGARFGAVVYVKHLDRTLAFYAALTGLAPVQREPTWVQLGDAPFHLVLHRIGDEIAATIDIASPPERRADTPLKLAFPVPSIAAARQAAAALGGTVDGVEREWRFGDETVCDGHDPEGNVFQLRERAR